jgi:hypothetical protein
MKRGPYVEEKQYPGCDLYLEDIEKIYEIFTSETQSDHVHITADNFELENFKEFLDIKKESINQLEIQTVLEGGNVIVIQFNNTGTALFFNDETIILGMITRIERIINIRKRFFGDKKTVLTTFLISLITVFGSLIFLWKLNMLFSIFISVFFLVILLLSSNEIVRGKYSHIHLVHRSINPGFFTKYRDWIIAFSSAFFATLLGFALNIFFK